MSPGNRAVEALIDSETQGSVARCTYSSCPYRGFAMGAQAAYRVPMTPLNNQTVHPQANASAYRTPGERPDDPKPRRRLALGTEIAIGSVTTGAFACALFVYFAQHVDTWSSNQALWMFCAGVSLLAGFIVGLLSLINRLR